MARNVPRAARVASLIKEELPAIVGREIKDPRVGFVTVTHVDVSPDLQHARVMVSILGDDPAERAGALAALGHASGYIRRALASRLQLRQTPDLSFKEDTSLRDGARIEQLISEWKSGHDEASPPMEAGGLALEAAPASEEVVAHIVDVIKGGQCFLFVAHLAPDGDSLGSALALAHAMWAMGKDVAIVNRDVLPRRYRYLPYSERVQQQERMPARAEGPDGRRYDAVFTFECPDVSRTGWPALCAAPEGGGEAHFVVNIDHHMDNSQFGDLNWIDVSSPAVGEMIHRLILELGAEITPAIATCIYTAVMTDTGSFTYSNTSAYGLRLGADMVDRGASPYRIALAVYDSNRFEKLELLGKVLARMVLEPAGRVAWIYVTESDLQESGASCEETDDFVNYPRSIEGVVVALIFKQVGARRFKVSLRSKDDIDVFAVAKTFGGGGHKSASGCTIEGELETVRERVLSRVREELERRPS